MSLLQLFRTACVCVAINPSTPRAAGFVAGGAKCVKIDPSRAAGFVTGGAKCLAR